MTAPIVIPAAEPADVPIEMRAGFIMRLRDNTGVPTAEVWNLLMACRDGNLARVEELLAAWPTAVRSEYNYMPPLHLAVREGHLPIVRFLAERGAVNPKYRTYPYNEPLVVVATDRGAWRDRDGSWRYTAVPKTGSAVRRRHAHRAHRWTSRAAAVPSTGRRQRSARRARMLTWRASADPYAMSAEGILSMPANRRHLEMMALLMRHGARVPAMTKWAADYYFKHADIAALLLERGMSARHMNCHRTTLLHEMARRGELTKARLLLDHGAEIDAVDDEFKSTPLGFAARWGQAAMVRLLLDHGADRRSAGAGWAEPAAWARRKGHDAIAGWILGS